MQYHIVQAKVDFCPSMTKYFFYSLCIYIYFFSWIQRPRKHVKVAHICQIRHWTWPCLHPHPILTDRDILERIMLSVTCLLFCSCKKHFYFFVHILKKNYCQWQLMPWHHTFFIRELFSPTVSTVKIHRKHWAQ